MPGKMPRNVGADSYENNVNGMTVLTYYQMYMTFSIPEATESYSDIVIPARMTESSLMSQEQTQKCGDFIPQLDA